MCYADARMALRNDYLPPVERKPADTPIKLQTDLGTRLVDILRTNMVEINVSLICDNNNLFTILTIFLRTLLLAT